MRYSGKCLLLILATTLGGCAATAEEQGQEASSSEQAFMSAPERKGDCRLTLTAEDEKTTLRVDFEGEGTDSDKNWFDVELPTTSLPLEDGFKTTIKSFTENDQTKVSYADGELKIVDRAASNFTTDTIVMTIDPNLNNPGKVTYERKLDLWLRPFDRGSKFTCTGWKP